MHLNENCPITKQIDNIDDTIKELNLRIGSVEKKLGWLDPDNPERKTLAQELIEIKKLVGTHESNLKDLRKKNRKSFLFCGIIIFLIFLLYSVYVLMFGY